MELAANILALAFLFYHGALAMGTRGGRLSVSAALKTLRRAMESIHLGAPTGWFLKQLRAALRDEYHRRPANAPANGHTRKKNRFLARPSCATQRLAKTP